MPFLKTSVLASIISASLSLNATTQSDTTNALWQPISDKSQVFQSPNFSDNYQYSLFRLDFAKLSQLLKDAPLESPHTRLALQKGGNTLSLTMADGRTVDYMVFESPIMAAGLQKKFPAMKTYRGYQIDNPQNTGRFDITKKGFHAMFTFGGERHFIDPVNNSLSDYRVYNGSKALKEHPGRPADHVMFEKEYEQLMQKVKEQKQLVDFGTDRRTYRLAVSAAAEFTAFHGGTVEDGLAAVVTTINRVNEVYEVDLAVRLELVANNDQLIYTDSGTDPFNNDTNDINVNDTVIDGVIGDANYDVGHVVNTAGGGLAGLGVVCSSVRKASGVTGLSQPTNDVFYIDYVAHEIGHQFGGNHTFNGGTGSCTGGNRNASTAYEPGSGTTIMAYAGICGEQNIQNNSDAFFHSASIEEIRSYMATGGNCGTDTSLNNNVPTVDAGTGIAIPASTPFKLTATGGDADSGDAANLTYSWEQLDLGLQTSSRADMIDDGERPLFRSFLPTSSPARFFPELSRIVAGTSSFDQVLPTTSRTMNFRVTVRDGRGGVAMDTTTVAVDNSAGPFTVDALPNPGPYDGGEGAVVNWNVANTTGGNVNCANVNIVLSDNGGESFETELLAGTPNDGTETVLMPNLDISDARLMVECSDGSFFNVSPTNFAVVASFGVPIITGQSAVSTIEDQGVTLSLSDITVSDENSTFPEDFTLIVNNGNNYTFDGLTVTPAQDYDETLNVNVTVFDGEFTSPVFPLSISITPVNDAPSITDSGQNLSMFEDQSLEITLSAVSVLDVDSDTFTLEVVDGNNYSVSGNTISPDQDFAGNLSISLRVNDGELDSNTIGKTVIVNGVNDAPVAVDDAFTVRQGSSNNTFNPLSNDTDVDAGAILDIISVDYSGNGALTIDEGNRTLSYSPAGGFNGVDTFTYTIQDNSGATSTATGVITVTQRSGGGGGGSLGISVLLLSLLSLFRRNTKR